MGYKRSMIHRMADELNHIAYSDDPEKMDPEDAYTIIDAIFYMSPVVDDLSAYAVDLFTALRADPDSIDDTINALLEAIASRDGYSGVEDYMLDKLELEELRDSNGWHVGVYMRS